MKTKYMFIALPFLIFQSAFALNDKPEVCPSLTAIQTVGVNNVIYHPAEGWEVKGPKNRYGTKEEWRFSLAFGKTLRDKNALATAKEFMAALVPFSENPVLLNGKWVCYYIATVDSERGIGWALTPPDETNFSRKLGKL
jgi:hypothetical protein